MELILGPEGQWGDFRTMSNGKAKGHGDVEACSNIAPDLAQALELGKGFAFVARQKHVRVEGEDCFIDLVFYNYLLKCFVLVDLKVGKLAHQDVGQMDMYVRVFDEQHRQEGDNPTLGLILCSERNAAVAKCSLLADKAQLFASKYQAVMPTEAELQAELERDRALLEID